LVMLLHIAKIPRSTYSYHCSHLVKEEKHAAEKVEIHRICEQRKGRQLASIHRCDSVCRRLARSRRWCAINGPNFRYGWIHTVDIPAMF
jgi:hypothetical protein